MVKCQGCDCGAKAVKNGLCEHCLEEAEYLLADFVKNELSHL